LDASRTKQLVQESTPDVVIHTQAMSDVDRCEQEPSLAEAMNVRTTAHLVEALRDSGALLMHLSTDYVFDGRKRRPYDETDTPNPLSVYGRSKLEGERVALGYTPSLVIRPSTLFGPGRMNFCDQIVLRVRANQPVEAFTDQQTSPTYTEDLAEAIAELVRGDRATAALPARILHIANADGCSRVEFAQRTVGLLGKSAALIQAIRMAEQRRPAPRPAYSVLTSRHLPALLKRILPPWDNALERYLRQRHWIN
jgi:dTDP-4-dehydrorhamnose reductase